MSGHEAHNHEAHNRLKGLPLPVTRRTFSRASLKIGPGLLAVLTITLAAGCGSSSSTTGISTSGKGLNPRETTAPATANTGSGPTISSGPSGGESSSAVAGEASAEIVNCSSNSEGLPVAEVSLTVSKEDPHDPSYTVAVIFRPADGGGAEGDNIFRTTLTTVTTASGTVEVPYPNSELENVPVACAISSVAHLENLNNQEQSVEIQGEGPAVPQS